MFLPCGPVELTYFLTVVESAQAESITQTEDSQYPLIAGIGAIIAVAVIAIVLKSKRKQNITPEKSVQTTQESQKPFDLESTLSDEDMREDDKEIIKFIHENGGEALESELRKKFLLPRTTMWRAVKRLERQDKIEIIKKDQQNLVRLKNSEDYDE